MKIIILTFVCFSFFRLNAQEVISAAGGTKSTTDYKVSWTAGETTIQTFSEGNVTLTQGFHQPKLIVTPAQQFADDISIKVYPNPTQEFITIRMNKLHQNSNYLLFNLSGGKNFRRRFKKSRNKVES